MYLGYVHVVGGLGFTERQAHPREPREAHRFQQMPLCKQSNTCRI